MTLWPISMLSRIFDSDSAAVPAEPGRRQEADEQQAAAGDLEAALGADHLADVVDVALAEVGDDARSRIASSSGAEGVELLGRESRARRWRMAWLLLRVRVQRSRSTSPTGTETQMLDLLVAGRGDARR